MASDQKTGRMQPNELKGAPSASGGVRETEAIEAQPVRSTNAAKPAVKRDQAKAVQAAVFADDQRQTEMDFEPHKSLRLDEPNEANVAKIEDALSELDRLERGILSSAEAIRVV